MIGRGNSIKHTGQALAYAGDKLQAVEIDRQYVHGESPTAIAREFAIFQDLNTRCEKNTLAFVLSPTIEDGKKLTTVALRSLTREFIQGMGLEEHQYVAYAHRDKAHQHVHLYVNRIDLQGKAYDDSYLSNRSSRQAETIALGRGLKTARQVQQEKQAEKKVIKQPILEAHRAVLTQAPKGIEEYTRLMKQKGVETLLKRNQEGKLIGVQFVGSSGEKIKASDVDRSLTANRLEKTLSDHAQALLLAQKQTHSIKPPTKKPNLGLSR